MASYACNRWVECDALQQVDIGLVLIHVCVGSKQGHHDQEPWCFGSIEREFPGNASEIRAA
eukprot:9881-Eustigmatos_ZCMA.PRE.1